MERMKELVALLNEAAEAYYQKDTEIMSNQQYDALYDELVQLEAETGMVLANSPTQNVGYTVLSNLQKIRHESPILSLEKKMNLPKALVLTVAATTFCLMTSPAFAVEETTPQNMTCQEFMDMNPKSMTPVAFWVVNRNTDFSGGDYVDWHEVETVSVPKMLQECHKNPAAKLGDLSAIIKK